MAFKFSEGQEVMITVRGYEPRKGLVTTASIGGHKGNENVYWVTFESKYRPNGMGLWFGEHELQPIKRAKNE